MTDYTQHPDYPRLNISYEALECYQQRGRKLQSETIRQGFAKIRQTLPKAIQQWRKGLGHDDTGQICQQY